MKKLELIDINKSYDTNVPVLKNVSFSVENGEFLVLLGPSGCGKSTILSIIAGFEKQNVWATRIFIALICIWAWTGFYVLILNSAIQGIDKNIIHAAKLDRASTMVIYKKIIFPSISPSILLATVLATCSSFQMYVEIALITKGGPETATYTLAFYLYRKTFTYVAEYGYSSAIGIVIFLIILSLSSLIIIYRWMRTRNE